MTDNKQTITDRLEYLRGEIQAERISMGEIAELQGLAQHIEPGDVLLLEWAGVPEFPADEYTQQYIEHSKSLLPFHTEEDSDQINVHDRNGEIVAECFFNHAEFVAKACNEHDALDTAYALLEELWGVSIDTLIEHDEDTYDDIRERLNAIRTALEAAKQ